MPEGLQYIHKRWHTRGRSTRVLSLAEAPRHIHIHGWGDPNLSVDLVPPPSNIYPRCTNHIASSSLSVTHTRCGQSATHAPAPFERPLSWYFSSHPSVTNSIPPRQAHSWVPRPHRRHRRSWQRAGTAPQAHRSPHNGHAAKIASGGFSPYTPPSWRTATPKSARGRAASVGPGPNGEGPSTTPGALEEGGIWVHVWAEAVGLFRAPLGTAPLVRVRGAVPPPAAGVHP